MYPLEIEENSNESEADLEILKESPGFLDARNNLQKHITVDTFVGRLDAYWRETIKRGRPYFFDSSDEIGDLIFFDNNWTIVGEATLTNQKGRKHKRGFIAEYLASKDLFTFECYGKFKVNNATQSGSPIQIRHDIQNKKVTFIVRDYIPSQNSSTWFLRSGSYITAQV